MKIRENRSAQKYTLAEQVRRVLWMLLRPLFALSPRTAFGFRAQLLRLMGSKIGEHVHIYNSARIEMPWNLEVGPYSAIGEFARIYNLGPIRLGQDVTVSQWAHLCAGSHDYNDPTMPLLKLPIVVGDGAWICAEAFVGPGVNVGTGTVVAARAVLTSDPGDWVVVGGNPAKLIKHREQLNDE